MVPVLPNKRQNNFGLDGLCCRQLHKKAISRRKDPAANQAMEYSGRTALQRRGAVKPKDALRAAIAPEGASRLRATLHKDLRITKTRA
jgi:hypothetical protein